jgi:hypothetical protein
VTHPDLPAEQAYVDRAYEHLERMRAVVASAANLADGEVAQAALDAWAARRLRTFEDAERGLCFGRLDFENIPQPLYVGRRWVHDDERRQVVVNCRQRDRSTRRHRSPRTELRCGGGSAPRDGV